MERRSFSPPRSSTTSLFHSPQTCGASASSRTCCEFTIRTHARAHQQAVHEPSSAACVCSLCSRLSGLSPFLGDDDNETLNNILACQWNFEVDEFTDVSDEAKDFITRLLVKSKSWRMSATESLRQPWLSDQNLHRRLSQKVAFKNRQLSKVSLVLQPQKMLSRCCGVALCS